LVESIWIPVAKSLPEHRKLIRLAEILDDSAGTPPELHRSSMLTTMSNLIHLWLWSLENAPDGCLSTLTARTIAHAARFEGDPDVFLGGLIDSGFVDRHGDELNLHDWPEYGGKLHIARLKERDRWRERNSAGVPLELHENSTAKSKSKSKRESTSGSTSTSSGGNACMPVSEEEKPAKPDRKAEVAALFAYYKEKIQPAARLCPSEKIANRLKKFSDEELRKAIDHFAADTWWMENNASRGGEWFFHSDARIEQLLLLDPNARRNGNGNGRTNKIGPEDDLSRFDRYGSYPKA